jgi:ribosome biogenesis GTPase
LGYDVFLTSAVNGRGLDDARLFLNQHRSVMAGHSGVGKSTILNRLIPGIDLPTIEISESTGKGRHTTSHIEMFSLPDGGFVIDSPGIKVLGLWQLEKEQLDEHYPEMASCRFECRFTHCSHLTEPDCAVKAAVDSGKIAPWRYQNYRQIYESL